MEDRKTYRIKRDVEIDDDGNTLVTCPMCEKEINVAFSNIIGENMALGESVTCPSCNSTLDQVHPPKKITEQALKAMRKDADYEIERELKKMLKGLK